MSRLFDLIITEPENRDGDISVRLGIRLNVGEEATVCPVSKPCSSVNSLDVEMKKIFEDLEKVLDDGRKALNKESVHEDQEGISSEMSPEEIWRFLESISDESIFIKEFNGLEEEIRRGVAEYVLTSCNVFSGKPALFSSQYDVDTAIIG